MKLVSIIKAISSSIIWGLGQLFNKQYFKALFFFIFFVAFISIELTTSNYNTDIDPYGRISAKDFTLDFYENYYYYSKNSDPELEAYYNEVTSNKSNLDAFNEDAVISYLVEDLKENSVSSYKDLLNNEIVDSDDFNVEFYPIESRYNLFVNDGKYYREISSIGSKFLKEVNPVTGKIINDVEVVDYADFDIYYRGTTVIKDNQSTFYLLLNKGSTTGNKCYLNILNQIIYTEVEIKNNNLDPREITINYQLVVSSDYKVVYEYYQPGIQTNNGEFIQYIGGARTEGFKKFVNNQYNQSVSNSYTSADYNKFLFKVAAKLDPVLGNDFEERYTNFFYDRAGLFIKSFWSVITLGEISNVSYQQHQSVVDALMPANDKLNVISSYEIMGHVSVQVLLEGLIGIILFAFFMIPAIWSITDAYKVSNKKIKKEHVEGEKQYFKEVYENCFEYIILSPALFVLAFISIMPILFGFILAFTSISGSKSMIENFGWVGLDNFINLFNFAEGLGSSFGTMFWKVLGWTIIWAIFSTVTVFFGGLFQALILNSEHIVFRKFWRCILILPWAIPGLLSQMVFSVIFKETGLVNQIIETLGFYSIFENIGILGIPFDSITNPIQKLFYLGPRDIQWFTNTNNILLTRTTLIVVNIWLGFPYFMALMSGVMTSIDKTLYEAAQIDGATKYQQLKLITFPLVLYSTAPILIMSFSGNFNNFGVIYFITGGGPNDGFISRAYAGDTDILISWMYKLTVDYSIYNMASVFSVLIFIVVGSVTAWNLSRTRAFQED